LAKIAVIQMDKVIYTAKTHTSGGRDGAAASSDGQLDIRLAVPGAGKSGANPERLFAAGWSACFIGAMGRAARTLKFALPADVAVDAEIDLGTAGDDYLVQARLSVSLPGVAPYVARAIADRAHQICPCSRATRGNINVAITVA
jgi:lipoyl-dependent peroxiredoxin